MSKTFKLNGVQVPFESGQTILEGAAAHGVRIPTLCHWRGRGTAGICGVCAVEASGYDTFTPACSTPIVEGMEVRTDSAGVREARKTALQNLLACGQHNCLVAGLNLDHWTDFQIDALGRPWHDVLCPCYGDCELQNLAIEYGVQHRGRHPAEVDFPPATSGWWPASSPP